MSALFESLAGLPQEPGLLRPDATLDDTLLAVLDQIAHGVMVLEEDQTCLHVNFSAQQELGRRRVLERSGSRIQAVTPQGQSQLNSSMQAVRAGRKSLITMNAVGLSLNLMVVPLKARSISRALLMFARPAMCDGLVLNSFSARFGLTRSEEAVLAALCQGYNTPEVAQQLGVAVSTVRTHVRNLCAKTGSAGVRDLVQQIATLPPLAVASVLPLH